MVIKGSVLQDTTEITTDSTASRHLCNDLLVLVNIWGLCGKSWVCWHTQYRWSEECCTEIFFCSKRLLRVSQCKTCVSREIWTVSYIGMQTARNSCCGQGFILCPKGQDVAFAKHYFPFLYLESYGLFQINLSLLVFMVTIFLYFCFSEGEGKNQKSDFLWWANLQSGWIEVSSNKRLSVVAQ